MVRTGGAGGLPEAAPAIETRALVKWFGTHPALRGIDLCVAQGDILALFGPNGAGKTTLLRVLAGLVRPTSGTVLVAGQPLDRNGRLAQGTIGVLAHGHQLYEALTGRENLTFAAAMLALDRGAERVSEVLAKVGLEAAAEAQVRTYSGGMKRRLAMAKLMLREPKVLLLDEPYTSLDLQASKVLEEFLMAAKAAGAATILATHNLAMGYAVADRVAILRQGRLAYDARREEVSLEALRAAFEVHGELWGVE